MSGMNSGKKSFSLSTTDPEAFRRLIDAAADIGPFQMQVVLIKSPTASAPPDSASVGGGETTGLLQRPRN